MTRIQRLKRMHEIMLNANDENDYLEWVSTFPDEPDETDFEFIASDDETYNEVLLVFDKISSRMAKKSLTNNF